MTEAIIYRSRNGLVKGFNISGHAIEKTGLIGSFFDFLKGFFIARDSEPIKRGEYDLVCAAISAIGFTAVGALDELCGVNCYKELDGNLEMMLPEDLACDVAEKAGIILESMEIGLMQVEKQYPKHLHVLNKEV